MFDLVSIWHLIQDRLIPALGHRDYRVMWLGHVAGESSSWALAAALGWLVFNLADSNPSSWVGAMFLATMLPWFVVPVIVGFLTDRFSRRDILALAYAISLIHGLILTLLVFSGTVQIWHVLLLAFVNGSARAVHMGAIESLAANLVPANDLPNAYVLVNAGYYGTRLIGPGVMALLIGVIDIKWIFLTCAGFYGIGLFLVLQILTVSTGVIEPGRSLVYNALSGFRYVYGHRVLRSVILLVMFHCVFVMSFESLLPAISANRLNSGAGGVAYLHMMVGLGALLASIGLAPVRGTGFLGRLFLLTAVVSPLGNVALGIAPSLTGAMLGTIVIGVSHTGFMTISTIMIQSVTLDRLRGRVTSIYLIQAGGMMSFSYFTHGVLADVFEPIWILMIGGLAFLGVVTVSMYLPTSRCLYRVGASIPRHSRP